MADFDVRAFDDDGADHSNDFNSTTDEGWFIPTDFGALGAAYPFYLKHYNTAESAEIGATGTGLFNPFLNMNGDSTLLGFNTNDDIKKPHTDAGLDISDPNTDAIQLGDIPIVYRDLDGDGTPEAYYLINLDINENTNSEVSLEELQLFTSSAPATLADYHFDEGAALAFEFNGGNAATDFTLRFDLDATGDNKLILRDDGAGQGKLDYTLYLPVSLFAGSNANTYLTLFSQFGPNPADDAGFAEWNTLVAAKISGTKFHDRNGDGTRDADGVDNIAGNSDDEAPLAGFTMYIDINGNNKLDANEQTAVTDANGNFTFGSLLPNAQYIVREVLTSADVNGPGDPGTDVNFALYAPPPGAWDQTTDDGTGDQVVNVTTGTTNILIGNQLLLPELGITKSATVDGDCADTVGELINYTILVSNEGNVGLDNVVVTDDFADVGSLDNDADDDGVIDGDTDDDGILDVGETWTYTAFHTVTQEDIDNNGNYDSDADGINDVLRNVATANADAVNSDTAAEEVTDDATVDVCQDPALGIEKSATVDGDCADTVGELVNYTILVSNEGNVGLENVVVTDDFADVGSLDNDADDDGIIDGDTDDDGILDVGETWTYTAYHTVTQEDIDNNGNYDSDADGINDVLRNVATANADAVTTGEAAEEVTDDATVDVCQDPALSIIKSATVEGDCADTVGEKVNYTILVGNAGNVGLENVVVTDDMADVGSLDNDADDDGTIDGDTDDDGILDVGETWTYTAYHTVTQDDIDNNGNYDSDADGINDVLRNVATANANAVTTGEAAEEVTDDATVDVCQDPAIDLEKLVSVNSTDGTDGTFTDSDTQWGDQNVNLGTDVWFKVTVENTGNVTLTDVDIVDNNQTGGLPGTFFNLVVDGALTQNAIDNFGATLDGDTDSDGDLDVGETWTITYFQAFDPGNHVNEATVTAEATTTAEEVTDSDLAHYFSLVDTGLCPRTPGFWQNPSNGAQFWDGIVGNEKHAGEDGFPEGELLYAVDSDGDGFINAGVKGLLIGDYNENGLTDAGEDTLFVSFANAQTLINASNKQLNASSGDGRFMLGRDMVASWLNYLQGSGFGDDSDDESPTHYLNDAIDWMQIYSGTNNGGTTETFDVLKLNGGAVKTSASIWKDVQSGFDHSAGQMHFALDYYNNTGQTEPGGTHYANCEDEHLFEAIKIYQQSHADLL